MAIKPFNKVGTSDPVLRKMQDAVETPLREISAKAILDGQILKDLFLVSGSENLVSHKLGRKLTGWVIIQQDTNANIWATSEKLDQYYLVLNTSANCNLSLWVF